MKRIIGVLLIFWMTTFVTYASSIESEVTYGEVTETTEGSEMTEGEEGTSNLADDSSAGSEAGKQVGAIDGTAQGKIDFYEGKSNDYKRSIMSDEQIIKKYRLDKEVEDYRKSFLLGYKSVYQESYKTSYREGFNNEVMESTYNTADVSYTLVTMDGATITSDDSVVSMVFEEGAVYLQNNVRIDKKNTKLTIEDLKNRYIQASNVYNVQVKTEEGYMNVYKPSTLSFKYIGGENVGVYKLTEAGLIYYASAVNGSSIECVIDERTFKGGDYVVLIDKNYKGLSDIDENWAKDEIELMAKRGWLSGYEDGAFRPNEKVTRAEYAVILYNMLGWYNYGIADDVQLYFSDANQLGIWGRKAVYVAVVEGIINGYPDGSFRPNNKITYQEVEWLVQRVYKNKGYANFTWEDMAQVMMDEKGVISRGLTDKSNFITRDEVAYMFYILNRG
ncbi:MAG TPA: hypothetical protein DCP90_09340 [Clostridiales bacterium]|nr:MAG: hypothetical protein A2Y22_04730 [Clostridiales bacterium GWD2_32_59]HAN10797.1 hypothetical protein [Clostridiales bacterium]